MKFTYYMPDDGEAAEDARDVYKERYQRTGAGWGWQKTFDFSDHEEAVDRAAEMQYDAESPDWHDGERKIAVVGEDGVTKTYNVSIEYRPTFTATETKGDES